MFMLNLKRKHRFLLAALALSLNAPAWAASDEVEFFRAAQLDSAPYIAKLLAHGLDPNLHEPERGETGLIVALRYDSMHTVDLLLAQPGIQIESSAANGNTALMMAAYRQNKAAVQTLLEKGAKVNRPGWTALHYAAAAGADDIIDILLQHHADINALSPSGMTPLMMAAREGKENAVQLLLERGADASLKDGGFHLTAAEFARKADKPWIAERIDKFLADHPGH